jgi:hypothetical protein
MTRLTRAIGILAVSVTGLLLAPVGSVAWAQGAPPAIPAGVIDAITQAACNPTQLEAAVGAGVTANPTLAAEIAAVAVGQCPADAAGIAAAAAMADPAAAAEIVVAVILALPPGQQENDAPQIVVAVEQAVPDSVNQITTAITQLAFNPGAGSGGRENQGAPLVAPHTDVVPSNF